MAFPKYSPTTVNQFDTTPITVPKNSVTQLAQQDKVLNGQTIALTSTVTGVTLNYTAIVVEDRLDQGQYTLDYSQTNDTLAIGGGAPVDISGGDGDYVLTAPNGKKINALVVDASLAAQDESDEVIVSTGLGKSIKQIIWNQLESGQIFILGTQFINAPKDNNVAAPSNVTGVILTFDAVAALTAITPTDQIEVGTHDLDYVDTGTLLSIGGGTAVDVTPGTEFLLTAPNGKKVNAKIVGGSLPGQDENGDAVVTSYVKASKVITDPTLNNMLQDTYAAL